MTTPMLVTAEMEQNFLDQLEYVVAGIARNSLTVNEDPTKDANLVMFHKATSFVNGNRWNTELGEQLQKRSFIGSPSFYVPEMIEDRIKNRFREMFPDEPTAVAVTNFANKAKDAQTFCRVMGALYKKKC